MKATLNFDLDNGKEDGMAQICPRIEEIFDKLLEVERILERGVRDNYNDRARPHEAIVDSLRIVRNIFNKKEDYQEIMGYL